MTDGGEMTIGVIVIEELVFSVLLIDEFISLIQILVLDTVDGFGRTQTVRIIGIVNVQALVIN